MEILSPREVPLGGLRAMTVRRTLPQRQRTFVGAWCFVDHYGPDPVDSARRHGRATAPAHRAADRELAVHRRDRAPRLGRPPRVRAPGRAEPDDRRVAASATRSTPRPARPCSMAPSCGWRCPRPTGSPPRPSSTTSPSRSSGDGLGGAGLPRHPARVHVPGAHLQPAARRRAAARGRHDAAGPGRPGVRARPAARLRQPDRRRRGAQGPRARPTSSPGREELEITAPRTPCCSCSAGHRSASRS